MSKVDAIIEQIEEEDLFIEEGLNLINKLIKIVEAKKWVESHK